MSGLVLTHCGVFLLGLAGGLVVAGLCASAVCRGCPHREEATA